MLVANSPRLATRDTPLLQKRGENHAPWGKCTDAAEFARGEVEKIDGCFAD